VELRFSDGVGRVVEVDDRATVLDAALAGGVPLVNQCGSGSCGTCVARIRGGEVVMATDHPIALLPVEIEAGDCLTCSAFVRSDARFDLDYPSSLLFDPGPRCWNGVVEEVVPVSATVRRLTVEVTSNAAALSFRAGQYMRVRVPGTTEWRSYSMSTTPRDLPHISFLVRSFPGGAMTSYLGERSAVGDEIELEGPLGSFSLQERTGPHLMVAGGTGLAPMLSMLDVLRTAGRPLPPILLCFACSTEEGLFCLDELELREFWMPSLKVRVGVSRPTAEYDGVVATPVELVDDADLDLPDLVAYLCGPPGMVANARQRLLDAGVPESSIHAEQFRVSAT